MFIELFMSSVMGVSSIFSNEENIDKELQKVQIVAEDNIHNKIELLEEEKKNRIQALNNTNEKLKNEVSTKEKEYNNKIKEELERKATLERKIKAEKLAYQKREEARIALEKAKSEEAKRIQFRTAKLQGFVYTDKLPFPREYQEHLYALTKKYNIDYHMALAIIMTESSFKPNVEYQGSYGLMQIHVGVFKKYEKILGEDISKIVLDPYKNMEMGTHELGEVYEIHRKRGLTGDALDRAAWSSYNRGLYGYYQYGDATNYINKMYRHIEKVKAAY